MATLTKIACFGSVATLCLLAGCTTETLFQSNFSSNPIGSPPAMTQAIGTAHSFGPGNSVQVVGPIAGSTENWLQVSRGAGDQQIAGMQGVLSAVRPPGVFTLSAAVYIPAGAGAATILFGPDYPASENSLPEFLHLDFMPDNHVRIDDVDTTEFGTFPRNQTFDVFVTLTTNVNPATAHIALIGAGASGSADYKILPFEQSLAQQFGSVTFWMGYPWLGSFDATDIVVTHNTQ